MEAPHREVSEPQVEVPPLGLAYLAGVLEREGHEVKVVDMNLHRRLEEDLEGADLVGISCYTHNYHLAVRIMKAAKASGTPVVVGGPHVTALAEEALEDGFDYVIRGEGEPAITVLAAALEGRGNLEEVPGLVYRRGGKLGKNRMQRVKDLDSLPLPARHLLELHRYSFPGAVATSRGCANTCSICSSRLVSGMLRLRRAEGVLAEVESLVGQGIDSFFFVDPNFASDRRRTLEICRGLKSLGVGWSAELRLDHMDRELIEEMAASGCRVVRFGIESGCQRMVDTIRKGIEVQGVLETVRDLSESGITPVCGFMVGFPGETREDFAKTIGLAKEIRDMGGEATFSILTPYPGTGIYNHAEDLGIRILHRRWWEYHHLNPVLETGGFTPDGLREALFDALAEYHGISIPRAGPEQEDAPGIVKILEGVERRSFRSLAMTK